MLIFSCRGFSALAITFKDRIKRLELLTCISNENFVRPFAANKKYILNSNAVKVVFQAAKKYLSKIDVKYIRREHIEGEESVNKRDCERDDRQTKASDGDDDMDEEEDYYDDDFDDDV